MIIVEGAGGWLAPIAAPAAPATPGPTMEQVALRLALPVGMVVGLRLGCPNQALLTAGAVRASGLPLAGWIANPVDPDFRDGPACRDSLLERLPCPLLWSAPPGILPSQ